MKNTQELKKIEEQEKEETKRFIEERERYRREKKEREEQEEQERRQQEEFEKIDIKEMERFIEEREKYDRERKQKLDVEEVEIELQKIDMMRQEESLRERAKRLQEEEERLERIKEKEELEALEELRKQQRREKRNIVARNIIEKNATPRTPKDIESLSKGITGLGSRYEALTELVEKAFTEEKEYKIHTVPWEEFFVFFAGVIESTYDHNIEVYRPKPMSKEEIEKWACIIPDFKPRTEIKEFYYTYVAERILDIIKDCRCYKKKEVKPKTKVSPTSYRDYYSGVDLQLYIRGKYGYMIKPKQEEKKIERTAVELDTEIKELGKHCYFVTITTSLFKMDGVKQILEMILKSKIFKVKDFYYAWELTKAGRPHCHLIFWSDAYFEATKVKIPDTPGKKFDEEEIKTHDRSLTVRSSGVYGIGYKKIKDGINKALPNFTSYFVKSIEDPKTIDYFNKAGVRLNESSNNEQLKDYFNKVGNIKKDEPEQKEEIEESEYLTEKEIEEIIRTDLKKAIKMGLVLLVKDWNGVTRIIY